MIRKRWGILFLFFLIVLSGVAAHPHMAIYSRCDLCFEGDRPEGLWMEFRFDRYFSADIIYGYDQDQDGAFDAQETRDVP